MAKAPAVQFYTGDFLTGTALMSNAEVGLYIRLLCLQAEHGAIPDDVERIVQAYGPSSRVLWPVVRRKFIAGTEEGTVVNERMAEVVAKRNEFRQKQSDRGKASAAQRFNHGSTKPQPRFNQEHGSTVVEPVGDGERALRGKERALQGFDPFWAAYPNKKARGAAIRAWEKLTTTERGLCVTAITAQVKANHFRGTDGEDYTPHPATWLNSRRWEDEVVIVGSASSAPVATGWLIPKRA